jgi:hypothetical protein
MAGLLFVANELDPAANPTDGGTSVCLFSALSHP